VHILKTITILGTNLCENQIWGWKKIICSKKCQKMPKKTQICFVISTLKTPKPSTSRLEIITFNDTEEMITCPTTYSLILILISCLDPDFINSFKIYPQLNNLDTFLIPSEVIFGPKDISSMMQFSTNRLTLILSYPSHSYIHSSCRFWSIFFT